jgi:hypothetical protein
MWAPRGVRSNRTPGPRRSVLNWAQKGERKARHLDRRAQRTARGRTSANALEAGLDASDCRTIVARRT